AVKMLADAAPLFVLIFIKPLFSADREDVFLQAEVDVLFLETRDLGRHAIFVFALVGLDRGPGCPESRARGRRQEAPGAEIREKIVEQTVHLAAEIEERVAHGIRDLVTGAACWEIVSDRHG